MNAKQRSSLFSEHWTWILVVATSLSLLMTGSAIYELFVPVTGVHYPRFYRIVEGSLVIHFNTPTVAWFVILLASSACIACCLILLARMRDACRTPPPLLRLAVLALLTVQGLSYGAVVIEAFSSIGSFG